MGKTKIPRRVNYAQQRAADDRARVEKLRQLCQNGITPGDMERACKMAAEDAFRRGKEKAVNELGEFFLKTCYAAALLAAHDEFGFGHDRCMKLLNRLDHHVTYSLTSDELVDEVFDKLRISIDFKKTLPDERIMEVGT